jgi:hypothetical protein
MRKIETQIQAAIANALTTGTSATLSNTAVMVVSPSLVSMYLHGHMIAQIAKDEAGNVGALISLAGWNTRITRSRLSLLIRTLADMRAHAQPSMTAEQCDAHAAGDVPFRYPSGLGVSSRGGVVRIHDARGETVVDANGWHRVEL